MDVSHIWKSALLVIVIFAVGLGLFVSALPRATGSDAARTQGEPADAIVVLTGTADRITLGLAALEAGRGKRILITGVHPDVAKATLASALGEGQQLFDCCVDIGRMAKNTRGNAEEAAVWAGGHGFRSLLVVTSAYHLPRSMVEFRAAMPDLKLVPLAVDRQPGKVELVAEYFKYLFSRVRNFMTSGSSV